MLIQTKPSSEGAIREVKKQWHRMQSKLAIPDQLTPDFGIQHTCETGNLTANSSRCVRGRNPLELITADTPDVSECLDFGFCDFVQCRLNGGLDTPRLGRWLGASHRVGKMTSCWILAQLGVPTSVTAVQRVTDLEKQTDEMKNHMENFQQSVQSRWDAGTSTIELPPNDQHDVLLLENEDEEFANEFNWVIKSEDLAEPVDSNEVGELGPDKNLMSVEVGI